jgi:hypothetical protein
MTSLGASEVTIKTQEFGINKIKVSLRVWYHFSL